jgi:hypothetical protein
MESDYSSKQKAFQAKSPGPPIHIPIRMGHRSVFEKGRIKD